MLAVIFIALILLAGVVTVNSQEYVLEPGDTLQIVILGEKEQQFTLVIRPDGYINLPIIGEIKIADMTIPDLTAELVERYRVYIRNPIITVILVKMHQEQVQVLGDVRTPGVFTLLPGANAIDAIMRAGGPNAFADLSRVTVQRRDQSDIISLDLSGMSDGIFKTDFLVRDGDIIFVPRNTIRVAVIGEVNKPGVYEIGKDGRLLDALMMAGGLTSKAKTGKITVYNGDDFNSDTGNKIEPVFQGNMMNNPKLASEQVVYVPRSYIWDIGIVTSVLSALSILKSLFGL
jgi:protein involved in polysaccharide export with SLBB domain